MIIGYQLLLLHGLLLPAVLLTAAALWPKPQDPSGTENPRQG
jgi:hypothetical protein